MYLRTLTKTWVSSVVYFDQRLGIAHPKRSSKSLFSAKKAEKLEKSKKFVAKFIKKHVF